MASSRKKERFLCGVVEGFYGRPWTMEQRLDLFLRMSRWGMNSYLYAPKDDDKHRANWRELYTLEEADELSQLIREASSRGVDFIYAISPGIDITFSKNSEVALLKRKLDQVTSLGCKSFAVLFDDIDCDMCPADAKVFPSFAHAQVTVTNDVYSHLGHPEVFLFCPTEYCATRAAPSVKESQYLKHLGEELHPTIDVMWTGPKVISKNIPISSIDDLSQVLQRPPIIWDNLHANDYDQRRLFLGPYVGRSVSLLPRLNGVLTNPNCEYGANYIAVHTLAQWSRCANTLSKRPSPTRQAMQLEVEGSTESDSSVDQEAVKVWGSPPGTTTVDMDSELEELHPYKPAQALEVALKEWILEFKLSRRKPEHYHPAKDIISVIKAVEGDENGEASVSGVDSVDARRNLTPVSIVHEEPELDLEEGIATPVSANPFTMEDLRLLVDYFYLPHQHGKKAMHILEEFCWLKEKAPGYEALKAHGKLRIGKGDDRGSSGSESAKVPGVERDGMRSDGEISEGGVDEDMTTAEVNHWCERAQRFHDSCEGVSQMCARLTAVPNRPLLYDIYQYMWDAKETTMLLDSYIAWLEAGGSEEDPEHEPHMPKGGITAEMQRLLPPLDSADKLFSNRKPPKTPSPDIFTIRPYRPEDKALVYRTCLETGDSGEDASVLFPNHPELLGERFVGPYITLSPNLSFVLEDSQGVCGYVLAALNSSEFYNLFKREWLPSVAEKYPSPPVTTDGTGVTTEQELLKELHDPHFFLPATLQRDFPSHLHIDLMRRAQGQGIGGRMIKTILAALKAKGSHGVHLEMSAHNKRALKFYLKLGFKVLDFDDDPQTGNPPEDILILGRVL